LDKSIVNPLRGCRQVKRKCRHLRGDIERVLPAPLPS
jgi:hypothetical protein